jgi:site-specific recombinase XerD
VEKNIFEEQEKQKENIKNNNLDTKEKDFSENQKTNSNKSINSNTSNNSTAESTLQTTNKQILQQNEREIEELQNQNEKLKKEIAQKLGHLNSQQGAKILLEENVDVLKKMKQELIVEGYSAKTLKMYLMYATELLLFVDKKATDISKDDIFAFLAHKKESGCENSTIALIHAAMGYMLKKMLKLNVLEDVRIPKKAKTLPKVLTRDEIKLLFSGAKKRRNKLMLQFMYGSGCRVSEVVALKINDINFKEKTAVIRGGKGNKDRFIILSKIWLQKLKKYLEIKKVKTELVFTKKNGKSLTTNAIERIVKKCAKNAGITKDVTPHSLRHSYATHLLEAGTNIRYIQSLLGHASLNTTQIYTNVANEQLKKIESPLDKL